MIGIGFVSRIGPYPAAEGILPILLIISCVIYHSNSK